MCLLKSFGKMILHNYTLWTSAEDGFCIETHHFHCLTFVQFICMGGTPKRMESFAYFIMKEIGQKLPTGTTLLDISQYSYRYSMYKVGPVLSISVSIFKLDKKKTWLIIVKMYTNTILTGALNQILLLHNSNLP